MPPRMYIFPVVAYARSAGLSQGPSLLGDCGNLMQGKLFSVLSVKPSSVLDANLMLWVFSHPVADVTLVVTVRWWQ